VHLYLGPEILVIPAEGGLSTSPCYNVDIPAVSVGAATGPEEREQLLRCTFGSVDWLWSGDDEFRFDRSSRTLTSVTLRVPESATLPPRVARSWLGTEATPASLQALTPENFSVPPTAERWVSEEADWLVCALSTATSQAVESCRRLRIAASLDLVFQEGVYSGWILRDPAAHLVSGFDAPSGRPATGALKRAFKKYISFFAQDTYDLMADEDPATLNELAELEREILRLPEDTRSRALREQVTDQREKWYGR
jgi:hypothetical protein